MHGRLKVKTTAEQQEAKRKEREKKLVLYKAATDKIFAKRKKDELDQEMLDITGELLSVNQDFYTLWNIRREIFQAWLNSKTSEEMQKSFSSELYFLEQCLQMQPKSYGTWHQRCWIMNKMPEPNWERELKLCSRFLEVDERNFHCWDYRRFVVHNFGVSPENELEFATTKISTNFSNFSSWHYRSKLLPLVYPDESQPTGVKEDILQKEFELVQNAFFTDPSDQSAWFYHKWLLGKEQKEISIQHAFFDRKHSKLLVSFTKPVQLGKNWNVGVKVDDEKVDILWTSSSGFSGILWMAFLDESLIKTDEDHSIALSLFGATEPVAHMMTVLDVKKNAGCCSWVKNHVPGTLFSREFTSATSDILRQEIDSCKQLHELEPDNKWVILTLLSLMRALEPTRYLTEVVAYLDKLGVLDPMRTNYYLDLRSKFLMEDALESPLSMDDRSFCLTGKQLTAAYHLEHLAGVLLVDLSHNNLVCMKSGHLLQSIRTLKLNDNCLRTCSGIERLAHLEELDLSNNDIQDVHDLAALASCTNLQSLTLIGNPLMNAPDCREKITELLPSVVHLL